jgi:hypothetical protein
MAAAGVVEDAAAYAWDIGYGSSPTGAAINFGNEIKQWLTKRLDPQQ